jgi:ABC-type polysaccharide/polyol phosphate transport system ATPase subunit
MAAVFHVRAKSGGEILMDDSLLLRVDHVSKKFCRRMRQSMYYGMCDVARGMMGCSSQSGSLRSHEFWALQDVTFSLKRGERLGLLGRNGSGKSTLLRLLAGIYQPDAGRIEIRGNVCALIALGAGFHPLLTGRENIYLNGALLGMAMQDIRKRFDQIVDFAGIGECLDAPVKTYSSGMHVRLGFAIAIHSDPALLLIDEVLAVGDSAFQDKCIEKVLALNRQGTAIVFVSHSVLALERLCLSGLLLKEGRPLFRGDIRECIRRYYTDVAQENVTNGVVPTTLGSGKVMISEVKVYQDQATPDDRNIEFGKDFYIEFAYRFVQTPLPNSQIRVAIKTFSGRDVQKLVFQEEPFDDGRVYQNLKLVSLKQSGTIRIKVLNPRLFPQTFIVDVAIAQADRSGHLGGLTNAAIFNVVHPAGSKDYFEYGNASVTAFDYDVADVADAVIRLAHSSPP